MRLRRRCRGSFRRFPAMILTEAGQVEKRGRWRTKRDQWLALGLPDGGVPATQSEAEREGNPRGERERKEGNLPFLEIFPKWQVRPLQIPNSKPNLPKYPWNKNPALKFSRLLLIITFPYEFGFLRTSCLRTRFNTLYNFREENLFKFQTLQKVNSWTP